VVRKKQGGKFKEGLMKKEKKIKEEKSLEIVGLSSYFSGGDITL